MSRSSGELTGCDPRRYGKQGVMRCPHGCLTGCERDRRAERDRMRREEREALDVLMRGAGVSLPPVEDEDGRSWSQSRSSDAERLADAMRGLIEALEESPSFGPPGEHLLANLRDALAEWEAAGLPLSRDRGSDD